MTEQREQVDQDLDLLIHWEHGWNRPKPWYGAAGSVVAHIVIAAVVLAMPAKEFFVPVNVPPATVDIRKQSVPLVAPRDVLTQKAPNVNKPAQQLDLAGLMARPEMKPSVSRPALPPPAPTKKAASEIKVEQAPQLSQIPNMGTQIPILGTNGTTPAPAPPPPPASEKPKLAFETPGTLTGSPRGQIEAPQQMTVADAAKKAMTSRNRGVGSGMMVGDLGGDPTPGLPALPGTQGKSGNSLELLSDPQGVDFRPYLVRVLAAVRRNWFAVMPESARMGMRGRAVIQFSIAKNGGVPKLVISMPSGSDHLDRAAVAGISASNPFPPLPNEFKGSEIRLQLVFAYNMPRQ
ncbi:hypothetical protein F183_A22160 [Bryobacterales bacterium F-183]|nr:hypothetical protein F183_A22160 [Bryobacterales bacterium F-183]